MEPCDFGWALKKLRDGLKVQREGWNGKGMWIGLVAAENWGSRRVKTAERDTRAGVAFEIPTLSFIGMKTADGKFVPWLASQTDVLATDWSVVE
jgi:Protein of unknown function (DUF2829)